MGTAIVKLNSIQVEVEVEVGVELCNILYFWLKMEEEEWRLEN